MAVEEGGKVSETTEAAKKSKEASAGDRPEPWLNGSLADVPAIPRAVLHALELAALDLHDWCGELSDEEVNACPEGVPPIAFHLRHIARSLDRLLTYVEGRQLSPEQVVALGTELIPGATTSELFAELRASLEKSAERVRTIASAVLDEPRFVGRKRLPTTVGGLLVHCADHTQRHVGQAVTTAKILTAKRSRSG